MASNDVIQRTEELISVLKQLSATSGDTGTHLNRLEDIVKRLGVLNLSDIRETSTLIANFNRELRAMGGGTAQINQVKTSFLELARTMEHANTVAAQFSALSRMRWSEKRAASAPLADTEFIDAWKQQSEIYNQQKVAAADARKVLREADKIWRENLIYAEGIAQIREMILRTLYMGGTMMLPPGGLPPQFPGNIPPLPPGNVPLQLPSGMPSNQLPTGRIPPRLPMGPILQPTGNIPYQLTMLAGVTQAENERLIQEEIARRRAGTQRQPGAEANAEDFRTTPGTTGTGRRGRDIFENAAPFTPQSLQAFGLSSVAARNLDRELRNLGMTSGVVRNVTTEMSTGITTVSLEAQGAGGSIQRLTAHLDKNGNVLQDTQKRFRSFGSAVMRDVVEVLKWTIAISAIYGPIRKMGEMMEEMKKIQLDLVDVQIVLGNSTQEMNTVLEASSQIATQTSSSLEGVVEGYSLAAAAASSAGNEIQRTVATQTLLRDSMILSKLANIDQKQALDTLVGTLSQLGMGLTQGTSLLDSWVAVSKKANVSVGQMATSFTIVGSAAEEAGLNYNELNALVGALAQSTNLSADELGNAIRGIIAAMQTDKAQQSFAEYGIATKTLSGDFRDLMDILTEMKVMSQTGVLDEKAMGALTQAGGAGARRGAQLSALVKNMDVVMQLIAVSEAASGDAAGALALEMETLDAATTRLNNSFSMLAMSLGGEGGVLWFLTKATDLVTFLITQMRGLVNILRAAAPLMGMAFLAKGIAGTKVGAGLLGNQIPASLAKMFTPTNFAGVMESGPAMGQSLAGTATTNKLFSWMQGLAIGSQITSRERMQGRPSTWGEFLPPMWGMVNKPLFPERGIKGWASAGNLPLGLNKMSLATVLAPAFTIAASNIGKPLEEAIPRALMGAAGAIPGILAGSTLWATIGAIMAQGFYDKFMTLQGDIATGLTQYAAGVTTPGVTDTGALTNKDFIEELSKQAGAMAGTQSLIMSTVVQTAVSLAHKLGFADQQTRDINELLTGKPGTGREQIPQEVMVAMLAASEDYQMYGFSDEAHRIFTELLQRWADEQARSGQMGGDIPVTPIQSEIAKEVTAVARYATTSSIELIEKALQDIANGVDGATQNFLNAQTAAEKLASTSARVVESQQQLALPVTVGTQTITPTPGYKAMTPEEAVEFSAGLNAEEASAIAAKYTELFDLLDDIRILNDIISSQEGPVTETQQKTLDEYATKLRELGITLPQLYTAYNQAIAGRRAEESLFPTIELPQVISQQQLTIAIEKAQEAWKEFLIKSGMDPKDVQAYIDKQQEYLFEANNKIIEGVRTNVPEKFIMPQLEAAGLTQMPGIEQMFDITKEQFSMAMAQYPQLVKGITSAFSAKGLTWQPNEETNMFMLKNGFDIQHVDSSLIQLLLKDILGEEKKQTGLQGMYNLPAGATFYVPVTAYEMSKATVTEMASGGGGTPDISSIINLIAQALGNVAANPFEAGQNLNEVAAGKGFEFGGREYKMFGPPAPKETTMLGYTTGNPLPVVVTNMFQQAQAEAEAGTFTPVPNTTSIDPNSIWGKLLSKESPAERVMREYEVTALGTGQLQTTQRPISTALNLSVDSKIILTVDGRTLASIIKPFLYEDLIRYGTSSPSSASRSVIA